MAPIILRFVLTHTHTNTQNGKTGHNSMGYIPTEQKTSFFP